MTYNVKLSAAAAENLRKMIGVEDAKINLRTGIIQVNDKDSLRKIAKAFEIDNVNHQEYKAIVEDAPAEEMSLDERNRIIGYDIQVGSVVRVKAEDGIAHAVIIGIDGDYYAAARLVLSDLSKTNSGNPDAMIITLEKGKDIVYRNLTYKQVVSVVNEYANDLTWNDFLKGAGGVIVGRVVKEDVLQQLIDSYNACATVEEEAVPEEPSGEETEETVTNEPEADQNTSKTAGVNFQKVIEESETLDELFDKLEVASELLKQAAMECIETGRSNVKKLIPVLQTKYDKAYGRLSQSAIKNKMNEEIKEWCESHNVDMEERSVSYFLKAIVKGLKKS